MDWLIEVAGIIFGWLLGAGGAVLDWFLKQGLAGWGAAATGVAAILAYLQYRDKRYGLSDGEWDILKALQKYRLADWRKSDGEVVYRFNRPSDEIDVQLDEEELRRQLNEYSNAVGKPSVTFGEILLRADKMGISGLPRHFSRSVPRKLIVSTRYRKYCHSLESRGYLSLISTTRSIEKYDLTDDGERFLKGQRKNIAQRYFLGTFVDEAEIIDIDIRSWHELGYKAVAPDFYHGGHFYGVEFPPSLIYGSTIYEEDNPCGVRYLIMVTKDSVDIGKVRRLVGHDIHLKVGKPTVHLLGEHLDEKHGIIANLKYCRDSEVWIEMWFGDEVEYTLGMHGVEPSEEEVEEQLKTQQKKIEETYYRNGLLGLPQPYWKRREVEREGYERKREIWISHRYETRASRYKRRVSETPRRLWSWLWSRLQRLAKRDKAD